MTKGLTRPVEDVHAELKARLAGGSFGKWTRFAMAALGGIPWIGPFLGVAGAGASLWGENDQGKTNHILSEYIESMREQMNRIGATLIEVTQRLDGVYEQVKERVESPDFLSMTRKGFRVVAETDSEEKRSYVRKLLCNAASTRIASDDVIRLFLDWIEHYNELHFRVIRTLYQQEGLSRQGIWDEVHGIEVAENSAEADLFKLLIDDLSQGHVLRQKRAVDGAGRFLKQPPRRKIARTPFMKSAFDDEKPYELTELGKQFVRYTMDDMVPQISA